MDIIIYIICFLILLRYVFVLAKYLKTGEFKKKIYKGNILGIIAYSFLTLLIVFFLILMVLVSKDNSSDLVMWIIFITGFGTIIMYPWFWKQRVYENARTKNNEIDQKINEEYKTKYGDEKEYFKTKPNYLGIPDDCEINDKFNALISIITNDQISFMHPDVYKNVSEVFTFLYKNDYIKLLMINDSIFLTCEKINSLLKKNNINLEISPEDITKDDDEFIKARRRDMVPTLVYDLNKINEALKNSISDYEIICANIYNENSLVEYPIYLCVVKTSDYNNFFGKTNNEMGDQ